MDKQLIIRPNLPPPQHTPGLTQTTYLFILCHRCLKCILIETKYQEDPRPTSQSHRASMTLTACRTCLTEIFQCFNFESLLKVASAHREAFDTLQLPTTVFKLTDAYKAACVIAGCDVKMVVYKFSNDDGETLDEGGMCYLPAHKVVDEMTEDSTIMGVNVDAYGRDGGPKREELMLSYLPHGFL